MSEQPPMMEPLDDAEREVFRRLLSAVLEHLPAENRAVLVSASSDEFGLLRVIAEQAFIAGRSFERARRAAEESAG